MSVTGSKMGKNPAHSAEPGIGRYEELGKTEARQKFLQLLNHLQDEAISLAITDRGEKVAVIMGYKQYLLLIGIFQQHAKQGALNPFAGLVTKVGDWERSKQAVNGLFKESLEKTAKSI